MRLYFSNGKNAYLTASLFQREYPNYRTLCSSTVLKVVSTSVGHGTVQDRLKTNCGRKKTIQVPRNIGIIAQKMWQTPTLSIRRLHLGTGLRRSRCSGRPLKIKVYRQPLVQDLLPGDIDKRVKWAEDYLEAAERDFTYLDYILWTDEAFFYLDGHVNRHNAVIWSVQNPHAFMECSNQKKASVMVWAGLIKDHIELAPSSSMEVSQGKCTFSYYSRGCGQPCKLSCGKRKNLLFSSIMEPQLIMKPMLELGWMESWRTDGWAEGDPYHGQHEVHIYPNFWLWGYLKNKVYAMR